MSELPEALKYVDGNYSESLEDNFIGLPGQLDGLYNVKALIDTGGGVNLISREWLKKKGIGIISTETSRLQNADTSISEPLPVMRMSWKFDDRNIIWTGVKFLVTETGPDALLGLPFLRHTQVIHDSKGHLVFPELADIPSPSPTANVYPIYHTKKVGPDA